jgi:two-component system phosphate regulon sensor histidine kinase PhoR
VPELNKRILVVDDEEIIRTGCARILQESGFSVEMASDGVDGFEKVSQDHFDLILLDLNMPVMDGFELLDKIRDFDRTLIAIVITAYASIDNAVTAIKKGAYDYLPKPFMPEDLIAKVNRGLEKRRLLLEADRLREERDRNLLEAATEKSRTRTIIDNMSEGIIVTNNTCQIALVNPAAKKLLRIGEKDIIGVQLPDVLTQQELIQSISETVKTNKTAAQLTRMDFLTEDGLSLQSNISPIISDNGECIGSVTVLVDLTEEKQIDKMKSDFVRMVSHELKAPLAAIQGYLNLILDGIIADNSEKAHEIIAKSRDKAQHLFELVNDILDLSRTEHKISKKMELVELGRVLGDVLDFYRSLADEKGLVYNYRFVNDPVNILGNRDDLSRLFSNLVTNAIKYTPRGGSVLIDLQKDKNHVAVSVTDTGIGIGEEDQKKIFSEFFRAENAILKKISGTGLGLAIAKKIAEEHQTYFEVTSALNKGSTFKVIFPIR